jgi:hypothetical protein
MPQRFVDAAAVAAEIDRVRSLSGAALRRRWQAEFGRPLPRSLSVHLLRRMIANRIQDFHGTVPRCALLCQGGEAARIYDILGIGHRQSSQGCRWLARSGRDNGRPGAFR